MEIIYNLKGRNIMNQKEQTKKEMLKYQMVSLINCVLDSADNDNILKSWKKR